MKTFSIDYDVYGNPIVIVCSDGLAFPIGMEPMMSEFLKWNAAQENPLDWQANNPEAQRAVANRAFRGKVVTLSQSAVGVRLQDLTAAQIKALAAALLYLVGAIEPESMTVRPLDEWLWK